MSQWTQADVDRIRNQHAQPVARSKYRNVKVVTANGEKFDSKREAAYWQGLKAREAAGEIYDLKRQVPFDLVCPTRQDVRPMAALVSQYIADFTFKEAGRLHVVDAKGRRTPLYALKAKWLALQDGIVIEEV